MGAAPTSDLRSSAQRERDPLITCLKALASPTAHLAAVVAGERTMPGQLRTALHHHDRYAPPHTD